MPVASDTSKEKILLGRIREILYFPRAKKVNFLKRSQL